MSIEWNEKYRIGNDAIDEQHKELFSIANRFLSATDKESQRNIAVELRQYTKEHFGKEESLMHVVSYPFTATHQGQHEALLAKLSEIEERLESGELFQADLESFINHWLVNHMVASDAPLIVYVKRHSLAM
jgi:hemerythrin-like metal-binding protein